MDHGLSTIHYLCIMRLEQLVGQVTDLFNTLDAEVGQFQAATSLKCAPGCGKCCLKPNIEATPLEFLPLALHLYRQGRAWEWFERLKTADDGMCPVLTPTTEANGRCSEYKHRGLICRLFGYSARANKHGVRELVTCTIVKDQTAAYQEASRRINTDLTVPMINSYYMQLRGMNHELADVRIPVNIAIRKAIETVLHYYAYREEAGEVIS